MFKEVSKQQLVDGRKK